MSGASSANKEIAPQLERFKAMAEEVGADDSPGALDRAFNRLKTKRAKKSK